MRTMYRKLLAERFALKFDRQKRELPVYLLEMAHDGPKLTRSLGDPNGPPDSTGNSNNGVHDVRYTDMTMDEFAQDLAFSEAGLIWSDRVNSAQLWGCSCCCRCFCPFPKTERAAVGAVLSDD